jgi:hypothetical protein
VPILHFIWALLVLNNINMKKYIAVLFLAFLVIPSFVKASDINNQTITLSKGWNIVSTPKVLSNHTFSATETSANFNIYLLDPTSASGWQTMQGAGQTEFQPLFAYFINNKTGTSQTLQLNYNLTLEPNQRLFQRTLNPGWNTVGIASPSYALPQGSASTDTNNPSNILSSISNAISQVIDFTNGNTNLDLPAVSNTWLSKTVADANSLNDFRELKGYGVFVTSATNNYTGSENLPVPVITLNGASTVHLTVGNSYTDAGATATDSFGGDITANIIVINPVNTSVAGTYHITYNVADSSNNKAQEVTRTVVVTLAGTLTSTLSASSPATQSVSGLSTTAGVLTQVKLMDFNLHGQDSAINVTQIVLNSVTASIGTLTDEVASIELRDGINVLSSVTGTATATFSSLNIDISQGTTKTLSIWVQMNPIGTGAGYTTKGAGITATLDSSAIVATDASSNTITVASEDVTSGTQYMFQYAPTLTLGAISAVQADESTSSTVQKGANYSIAFTVTAPSGSDIYVDTASIATVVAYTATTAGTSPIYASIGGTLVTSSTVSGVSSKGTVAITYDKVAAGTSRTFTITGYIPHGIGPGYQGMHISGIVWTSSDVVAGTTTQLWGLSNFHTASVYVTL